MADRRLRRAWGLVLAISALGCSSAEPPATEAPDRAHEPVEICGLIAGDPCGPQPRTMAACPCENGGQFVCCDHGKITPLGCWDIYVGDGDPCVPKPDAGADVDHADAASDTDAD